VAHACCCRRHVAVASLMLLVLLQVQVEPLSTPNEGISVVSLTRSSAKNAIGRQLLRELQEAINTLRQERTTRVVVMRSSCPGTFSAGADLKVSQAPGRAHCCRGAAAELLRCCWQNYCLASHHHHITQSGHSINAIGPRPTGAEDGWPRCVSLRCSVHLLCHCLRGVLCTDGFSSRAMTDFPGCCRCRCGPTGCACWCCRSVPP
jgi:hypothetical protein